MLDSTQKLSLPLSDAAKAHFQKQGGSPKKKPKTSSKEEINTMILEKVEVAMKARKTDPKETDKDEAENVKIQEFNYDPATESENE